MEYTVIVPVYNEEKSLVELCDRVYKTFEIIGKTKDFEILFVDDGSRDLSKEILKKLCLEKTYVKSLFLRRNNGKALALMAGFLYSKNNIVITIDGDLQDKPEDIPAMIEKLNEGYDLVSGWKQKRQDSLVRVLGSSLFNLAVSYFGGLKLHDFNCGFKIYRADVVKKILVYGQYHRFIPLLVHFMGFKVTELPISHSKRKHGVSKYSVFRYQGLFDLLSILFTYKYRFSPLYFFGALGLLLIVPSFATFSYLMFRHTLFVLGLGDNYMSRITLLLPLSTTIGIVGVSIFLTGFVCDFILHHISKARIIDLVESIIEEKTL